MKKKKKPTYDSKMWLGKNSLWAGSFVESLQLKYEPLMVCSTS